MNDRKALLLAALVFVGPGPGMMTILRIVPQLRTNMNPQEIVEFILDP
jgi:hypothetical protein